MMGFADAYHGVAQALSQTALESTRNFREQTAREDGREPRLASNGRKSNSCSDVRKRIRFCQAGAAGELFQPHRRLPFERDLTRKAEQRGRGVEEPADRSGRKGPDIFLD